MLACAGDESHESDVSRTAPVSVRTRVVGSAGRGGRLATRAWRSALLLLRSHIPPARAGGRRAILTTAAVRSRWSRRAERVTIRGWRELLRQDSVAARAGHEAAPQRAARRRPPAGSRSNTVCGGPLCLLVHPVFPPNPNGSTAFCADASWPASHPSWSLSGTAE